MSILDIFRDKKYEVPCICDYCERPEDCLAHTLIHKSYGGYKKEKPCEYCNYDDVKYQYQVKLIK